MKTISLILAVYNVAPYIRKCLASIGEQTFRDYELILVDDCGSDNAMAVAQDFLSGTGIDYKIVRNEKNIGVSASREAGIKAAAATFILFIDPDDWIESTMLEALYNAAMDNGADIVACNGVEYWEQEGITRPMPSAGGIYRPGAYLHLLFNGDTTAHMWLRMVKRSLYKDISFPHGVIFEDFLVVPLLISKANMVVHLDKVLYYYVQRGSGDNLTTSRPPDIPGFIYYLNQMQEKLIAYQGGEGCRLLKKYELTLLSFILSRLFRAPGGPAAARADINTIRAYIKIKDLIAVSSIMNKKSWLLLLLAKLGGTFTGKIINHLK